MHYLSTHCRWQIIDFDVFTESGCDSPPFDVNNGHILLLENTKKVLVCNYGYHVNGSSIAFCNGESWDRPLGTCAAALGDSMSCDFETNNLCGWQSELRTSFVWKRRNGWVSFEQLDYGPKHDHTVNDTMNFRMLTYEKQHFDDFFLPYSDW